MVKGLHATEAGTGSAFGTSNEALADEIESISGCIAGAGLEITCPPQKLRQIARGRLGLSGNPHAQDRVNIRWLVLWIDGKSA